MTKYFGGYKFTLALGALHPKITGHMEVLGMVCYRQYYYYHYYYCHYYYYPYYYHYYSVTKNCCIVYVKKFES